LWCIHRKFSYESVSERILKIGPDLPEFLTNIRWLTFLRHSVHVGITGLLATARTLSSLSLI